METMISHIDGIGAVVQTPKTIEELTDAFDPSQLSADLFDMVLLREQKALEKELISGGVGVGNSTITLDGDIDALDEGIRAYLQGNGNELILLGDQHNAGGFNYHGAGVSGIGSAYDTMREVRLQNLRNQRLQAMVQGGAISGYGSQIGGIGNFFKKIGQGVTKVVREVGKGAAKVGKGIVNVVTFPLREVAKLAIRIFIPGMSPFFLYIFTPATGLPPKVARKRMKALRLKGFIVNRLKMRESTFDGLIRNGIMKKLGKTPEQAIQDFRSGLSGIGAAWIIPAITALISLLKKITGGKPPENVSAEDAPAPDDWSFEDILETAGEVVTPILENQGSTPGVFPRPQTPFTPGANTGLSPVQRFQPTTGIPSANQSLVPAGNTMTNKADQSGVGNNALLFGGLALAAFMLLK